MARGEDIEVIMRRWIKRQVKIMQESAASVTQEVIDGTPVLEGDLRASWTPDKNKISTNNSEGGSTRTQDYVGVCNSLKPGDRYTVNNGKPQARRIEYEGWSAKAPNGMRDRALANWQKHVDDAVRRNS